MYRLPDRMPYRSTEKIESPSSPGSIRMISRPLGFPAAPDVLQSLLRTSPARRGIPDTIDRTHYH